MAIEDNLKQEVPEQEAQVAESQVGELSDDEEDDLRIAVLIAQDLIDDGGYEVIERAQESSDPGQVIGQFLMQMVSQLGEQLPKEMAMSPRIWLAKNGWVEQISDYLQEEYDIPAKIMDRAEIYIATTAESIAKGRAGQQAETAPAPVGDAQAGPVVPQGGMA